MSDDQRSPAVEPSRPAQHSALGRFLGGVEWLGNRLPHPVTLFALLAAGTIVLSALLAALGVSVPDPRPPGSEGRAADGMLGVVSLMNAEGLRRIVTGLVPNFTGFAPLGVVLVAMLGVGVAEKSGVLSAAIRGVVLGAPRHVVTIAIIFAGVISNTASEVGYVVLIPLAGVVFQSLGRNPIAGMAAAFAGVSGGYSANILLGTVDPLLAGITEEAAQIIAPDYRVAATASYYFMAASTFLITAIGTLVTVYIVEPRLGRLDPSLADPAALVTTPMGQLSALEKRGLRAAGLAALLVLGLMTLLLAPASGPLRDPVSGDIFRSPFFHGFVLWIMLFFLAIGLAYGRACGTLKTDRDVIDAMAAAISRLGLYVVMVFFASQFVAFFNWSNIGTLLAVAGASLLQNAGLTGPAVFVLFILICCCQNLVMSSSSGLWAVTAPIFVPMLMLTGYSPEVIQSAYRIGDSTTNIITPMMGYFGLILSWAMSYNRNFGLGTLIATMLPYSVVFTISWVLFFLLWVFGLHLPVGPGTATYFPGAP